MTGIYLAGFAGAAYLVTLMILPVTKEMLTEAGFLRPNFRKEQIPSGVGLVFFLTALVVLTVERFFIVDDSNVYTFLFAVGGMGFFGLIDDVFGTRGASGLKGHFKKLILNHEMTTGGLKALAGGMIALIVSLEFGEGTGFMRWVFLILNALIMALSTNAVNLLDLRPGRAGKGFLAVSLFILIAGTGKIQLFYLAAVAGSLIAFLPLDLKAEAMMGDTGSNMLGMTLGYVAVFVLSTPVKVGFFLFLVGFHLVTEKYSLTKIIENSRFLNYLDMVGRRQKSEE